MRLKPVMSFKLTKRETIVQIIAIYKLNIFIPDDIIKLICEPFLHDIVEYGHKKCFYREQFIKYPNSTEYLVLRKVKVRLRFEDVIRNSVIRKKFIKLCYLTERKVHNRNSFIIKFMIPKTKYDILLTNEFNIPIAITKSGCIKKESSTSIPPKRNLANFRCSPSVRPYQVNIHYNIDTSLTRSKKSLMPPVYISYYVYDIVVIQDSYEDLD